MYTHMDSGNMILFPKKEEEKQEVDTGKAETEAVEKKTEDPKTEKTEADGIKKTKQPEEEMVNPFMRSLPYE